MGLEDTLGSKWCLINLAMNLPNSAEKGVKTKYAFMCAVPAPREKI